MKNIKLYFGLFLTLLLSISCSKTEDTPLYPFIGNWTAISGYDQEFKNGELIEETEITFGEGNILTHNITLDKQPFFTTYFKETFENNVIEEGSKSGRWSTNEIDTVTLTEEDENFIPIDEVTYKFDVNGNTLTLKYTEKSIDQNQNTYEYVETIIFKAQ